MVRVERCRAAECSPQRKLNLATQSHLMRVDNAVRKVSERVELSAPAPQIAANDD